MANLFIDCSILVGTIVNAALLIQNRDILYEILTVLRKIKK